MADDSDRVIPATPRRREEARRQGMMPTAALPAWVASAAVGSLLLPAWAAATLPAATDLMRAGILAAREPRHHAVAISLTAVAMPTVAVIAAAALAGLAIRLILDGLTWQPGRLAPSLRRVDPFAGLARILSWRTLSSVAGGGLGLAAVAVAGCVALRSVLSIAAPRVGEEATVAAMAWRSSAMLMAAAVGVAATRWVVARRRFEQRIRMTPAEFAEEAKSSRADPKVRLVGQQRRRQPTAGAA